MFNFSVPSKNFADALIFFFFKFVRVGSHSLLSLFISWRQSLKIFFKFMFYFYGPTGKPMN